MLFIGHTRFSLYEPNSGAWVASNGTKLSGDKYRDYLFSDERMEPRCEIFFGYTLPQLAIAAAGHTFRHVVSYSESLPARYQEMLATAARKFPFLILDRVEAGEGPRNISKTARDLIAAEGMPSDTVFGSMRLDDDDILSADYFDQMAGYVTAEHAGYVVSLGRGVTALYDGSAFHYARDAVFPMHSKGHLSVCQFTAAGYIAPIGSAHNKADLHNPVILDSRKFSHVWVRSTTQDTALYQLDRGEDGQLARIYQDMDKYEELGESIDSAFPVLAGKVFTSKPSD